MSRTYVLPVSNNITGDIDDALPSELVFREQARNADPPTLTRSASRQYYPFDFDPVTGIYGQANQVIEDLGYIDPVELWERAGANPNDRNAPDDFIATISVRAGGGDPTGEALCTLVDSVFSPRLPSFILPEVGPPVSPTPSRLATRYGLPVFSGDIILIDWFNRPVTTEAAIVTINLTPCDGCALQAAVAAWQAAQKDCCAAEECDAPVVTNIIPDPSPILGGIGAPVNYGLDINGSGFLPTDVITLVGDPGIVPGIPFHVSGALWTLPIAVAAFTPSGPFTVEVARVGAPTCSDSADGFVVPPV